MGLLSSLLWQASFALACFTVFYLVRSPVSDLLRRRFLCWLRPDPPPAPPSSELPLEKGSPASDKYYAVRAESARLEEMLAQTWEKLDVETCPTRTEKLRQELDDLHRECKVCTEQFLEAAWSYRLEIGELFKQSAKHAPTVVTNHADDTGDFAAGSSKTESANASLNPVGSKALELQQAEPEAIRARWPSDELPLLSSEAIP